MFGGALELFEEKVAADFKPHFALNWTVAMPACAFLLAWRTFRAFRAVLAPPTWLWTFITHSFTHSLGRA